MMLSFAHHGCVGSFPGYETIKPGTYKHKLKVRVAGFRRSYLIHIPRGYDPAKPTPLVVALHGAYDTAKKTERETGLSELADREGFIALYPNGITLFGWLQHWNAGHCCGKAMKDGIDDLGFVAGVIEQAQAHLNVDPKRIYMVGYSNGGMLAYLFASEKPETLAAVAIIASAIGSKPSSSEPERGILEPKIPVPMIIFHGREDKVIPYEGGQRIEKEGHYYTSVAESVHFWVRNNGCADHAKEEYLFDGKVLKQTWIACKEKAEITLLSIDGWNHDPPTRHLTDKLPASNPLKGFHATDIIWEFFQHHQL
jgi:polyhydroxybutyrate depolymerase